MRPRPGQSAGLLTLALILGTGLTPPRVFAQGNTFNPYGNSGYRDYREFTQPMYSNEPSLPGQARLQYGSALRGGGSRANQFDAYSESLEGRDADPSSARKSIPGEPYYRAFRRSESDSDRAYPPGKVAEEEFNKRLKQRNLDYEKATKERDPAKRAQMLRQLDRGSLDRPAAKATAKGAAVPKATARAATAPAPAGGAAQPRAAGAGTAAQPRGAARIAPPGTAVAPSTTPRTSSSPRAGELRTPPASSSATTDPGSVPAPAPR